MVKKLQVKINKEECVGKWCGACVKVCPTEAILVYEVANILGDKCIGCGKCADNVCPNYAIIAIEES